MKVLLLKPVRNLGNQHDIVEVADGLANNRLIPQQLAIPANSAQAKRVIASKQIKSESASAKTQKIASALREIETIIIKAKTNEQGSLYQSVTAQTIASQLKQQGIDLSAKHINSEPDHIKETGTYTATCQVGSDTIPVVVTVQSA